MSAHAAELPDVLSYSRFARRLVDREPTIFGEVIIPTEKVTEMRNNKRVTKERKLYPG